MTWRNRIVRTHVRSSCSFIINCHAILKNSFFAGWTESWVSIRAINCSFSNFYNYNLAQLWPPQGVHKELQFSLGCAKFKASPAHAIFSGLFARSLMREKQSRKKRKINPWCVKNPPPSWMYTSGWTQRMDTSWKQFGRDFLAIVEPQIQKHMHPK